MERKKSKYCITIQICGALSILAFLFLPLYTYNIEYLEEVRRVSAIEWIRTLSYVGDVGRRVIATIQFGMPVLLSLLIMVFGGIGSEGRIGNIVCGAMLCVFYSLPIFGIGKYGYNVKISWWYYLVFPLAIFVIVLAVLDKRRGQQNTADAYVPGDERTLYDGIENGEYNSGYDRSLRMEGAICGIKGEYQDAIVSVPDGARLAIGRSASDCNLVLSDPTVSRIHCYITYFADRDIYGVTDVSKIGVYDTCGKAIEKNQMVYMASGDEIHIGTSHNVFRLK